MVIYNIINNVTVKHGDNFNEITNCSRRCLNIRSVIIKEIFVVTSQ